MLCDGWNWFWGEWWPTIDWGNAPGWVGAFLTSGSLFLAVLILRGDRQKDRRAHADAFFTYPVGSSTMENNIKVRSTVEIHHYNAGDRPIVGAGVWQLTRRRPTKRGSLVFNPRGFEEIINPGDKGETSIDFKSPEPPEADLILVFKDGRGVEWVRHLYTHKYLDKWYFRVHYPFRKMHWKL